MQWTISELQEIISETYGFQKELIKNPEVCGLWHVRFEVNGIMFYGSTPYYGAKPCLKVTGYNTKHFWRGTPITEEYYEEHIKGKQLVLRHCLDIEAGEWESMPMRFNTVEEAEEYISDLKHPEFYSYELVELVQDEERGADDTLRHENVDIKEEAEC